MEHQLWKTIVTILAAIDKPSKTTAFDFQRRGNRGGLLVSHS